MSDQKPTKAPDRFLVELTAAMKKLEGEMSLRQVAYNADISPAYLSRLLNGERGVPSDDAIKRLECVLRLEPGTLLNAAGRHDAVTSKVFDRGSAPILMRSLATLTEQEFAKVVQYAQTLARKHQPKTK